MQEIPLYSAVCAGTVLTEAEGAGPEDLGLKLDALHVYDALCRGRCGVACLVPGMHQRHQHFNRYSPL